MSRPSWTVRSNSGQDQLVGVMAVVIGIPFILLTVSQLKSAPYSSNVWAAFGLGVLLIVVGALALALLEEVTVVIDPDHERLTIQRSSRLGQKQTTVRFDQVDCVFVNSQGGSKAPRQYHLKIRLKTGRVERTGKWSLDQSEIHGLGLRMAEEIGCAFKPSLMLRPPTWALAFISAIGAVLVYGLFFRIHVGPLCPAMFFGTAPPLIMLTAFSMIFGLLRLIPLWPDEDRAR